MAKHPIQTAEEPLVEAPVQALAGRRQREGSRPHVVAACFEEQRAQVVSPEHEGVIAARAPGLGEVERRRRPRVHRVGVDPVTVADGAALYRAQETPPFMPAPTWLRT